MMQRGMIKIISLIKFLEEDDDGEVAMDRWSDVEDALMHGWSTEHGGDDN